MKKNHASPIWLALAICLSALSASAEVAIEWVDIGLPGNLPDPAGAMNFGAVAYPYKIGKYEVTNPQYIEFLNAVDPTGVNPNGIYNSAMGTRSGRGGITFTSTAPNGAKYTLRVPMGGGATALATKPVNNVNWFSAARFINWMHNGQGSGSTETGAYTLNGNRGNPTKNPGASFWLPTGDEWHKAAYYDPNRGGPGVPGYWLYPTQSNDTPLMQNYDGSGNVINPGPNVAIWGYIHYLSRWEGAKAHVGTVGSAQANNYFGTCDMAGNVVEFTDTVLNTTTQLSRVVRGGAWAKIGGYEGTMKSDYLEPIDPNGVYFGSGIRVVCRPVVTYSGNGPTSVGVPVDSLSPYANGATVTVLGKGAMTRSGYTFTNWNTKADGSGTSYAPGATFTVSTPKIFFAQWTPNATYTVTFDPNGGSTPDLTSKVVVYEAPYGTLATTTLAKYTFDGWFTAATGGTEVTEATSVTTESNHTLYAHWFLTPPAVVTDVSATNVSENGSGTFQVKLSDEPVEDITVIVTRSSGDTDITVQSGGSLTFTTSNWDTYQTVTLAAAVDADAENDSATITCDPGNIAYLPKNVVAIGIDKDTTLTLSSDGYGTTSPSGQLIVEKGAATAISATGAVGYDFLNWSIPSGIATFVNEDAASTTVVINEPATVQANFTLKTYLVTYNGNSNTGGTAPADQTKTHSLALTLATNTGNLLRSDYSFAGWNTAADGTGTDYPVGSTYTANTPVTLYAKWRPGADGTWLKASGGPFNWGDPANWTGGVVASGTDGTALFTLNFTQVQFVELESPRTIGNITFTDTISSNNLNIQGANILTLSRSSGVPVIDVTTYPIRILTINNQISGSNGLQKNGVGVLALRGTSNYTGGTILVGGTLDTTADANLGATSGSVTVSGNSTWRLGGVNNAEYTRNVLISNGFALTMTSGNYYADSSLISNTANPKQISGVLSGTGSLIWSSATNINFSNTGNTFDGPITVTTGAGGTTPYGLSMASLGDNLGAGNVSLGSTTSTGYFYWYGSGKTFTNRSFALAGTTGGGVIDNRGSGNLVIVKNLAITGTGAKTLTLGGTNTGNNTFQGNIVNGSSATSLSKTDDGKWILSGTTNTYSGTTTVSAGKLLVNGTLSNLVAALNVSSGATLGGTGTIGRDVTIAAGGKLEFNLSTAAGSHDRLDISSGRSFGFSGASELTITTSGVVSPGTYTLITGGNNITGSAPATLNLPIGLAATVSISGNSLLLTVTGVVDRFAISAISSPQTVGTPITGITLTAQNSSNITVTSFTGTVTFGGTAGITGTSANFVAGVLSGVSITPTIVGSNLTFTVNDGASPTAHTGSATFTVQRIYDAWAIANGATGGTGGNPDNDSLTNLQEFAFGTNPTVSTSGPITYVPGGDVTSPGQPTAVNLAVGGGVDFRAIFGRRKDRLAAGLTYTVEFSAGLDVWVPSTTIPTVLTVANSAGQIEAVSVPYPYFIPTASGFKKPTFFRVGVSGN